MALSIAEYRIKSLDGTDISIWRIAARANIARCSPAVVHAHGGGFILRRLPMESVDLDKFCLKPLGQYWLQRSGVVLIYVSYRIATEKPFPTPANDVYSALRWAVDEKNALELGIDRRRVGVMGFSAGGNLALTAALRARDERLTPAIHGLMLIYPMLDPNSEWETPEDAESIGGDATAEKAFLRRGWNAMLQDMENLPDEEKKFARLLSLDFTGLPPTYVDVGTADFFLEENRQLMRQLEAANVQLTNAEWKGMSHGFEGEKNPSERQESIIREARKARREFWRSI